MPMIINLDSLYIADATLVPYSADKEIANVIAGKEEQFLSEVCNFAIDYAEIVENDYNVFLEVNSDEKYRYELY
ncbi:hypothetical protein HZA75_07440 [Candidatus Roizmanbacteria bacterium]|nr:hypothetical protein [Candidatus Roizmanbacteria bacterium]